MKFRNSGIRLAVIGCSVAAALAAAAPAGAAVGRNQLTTFGFTADVGPGIDQHDYVLNFNPCDGSVTGGGTEAINGYDETLTCKYDAMAGALTCNGVYHATPTSGATMDGYTFSFAVPFSTDPFPGIGAVGNGVTTADGVQYPTVFTSIGALTSTWRNHGAYVAATRGGRDAAHSCIGMPVSAKGPK